MSANSHYILGIACLSITITTAGRAWQVTPAQSPKTQSVDTYKVDPKAVAVPESDSGTQVSTPAKAAEENRASPVVKRAETRLSSKVENQAANQLAIGDYSAAATTYRSSRDTALAEGDNAAGAEAAIRYSLALESWTTVDSRQVTRLQDAEASYDLAIRKGTPEQSAIAANNKGVLQLRLGRPQEAISTLKQVNPARLPPASQSLYQYNLAHAFENAKQFDSAFNGYVAALKVRPDFSSAATGAFRSVASGHLVVDQDQALNLVDAMVLSGQTESAINELYAVLNNPSRPIQYQNWLILLVRCIAQSNTNSSGFRESVWPKLSRLAGIYPDLEPGIEQVRLAYEGNLWNEAGRTRAASLFPWWAQSPVRTPTMSMCLNRVADIYLRGRDPKEALARYYMSWDLDPDNLESATYAAATSLNDTIPREKGGDLLNRIIGRLFQAKGEAYLKGDWRQILRFHMVLAGIFEKTGQWGPDWDSRTVMFQLEHAAKAEAEIRRQTSDFPPQPGLHLQLAEAYEHSGDHQKSWEEFVTAANEFADDHKAKEASDSLNRAMQMNLVQTPDMRMRFSGARNKIDALEGTA